MILIDYIRRDHSLQSRHEDIPTTALNAFTLQLWRRMPVVSHEEFPNYAYTHNWEILQTQKKQGMNIS